MQNVAFMQTIIQCRKGSCSPEVKNLGAGAMQSGTSVRNTLQKICLFHIKILETIFSRQDSGR